MGLDPHSECQWHSDSPSVSGMDSNRDNHLVTNQSPYCDVRVSEGSLGNGCWEGPNALTCIDLTMARIRTPILHANPPFAIGHKWVSTIGCFESYFCADQSDSCRIQSWHPSMCIQTASLTCNTCKTQQRSTKSSNRIKIQRGAEIDSSVNSDLINISGSSLQQMPL